MFKDDCLDKYIRPELAGFCGYSACKSPDVMGVKLGSSVNRIVKLDANENPYGASERVKNALACFDNYHIYPDATQTEARQLLSKYTGVKENQIVVGSGSDQLIDLIIRLFAAPGQAIINLVPTFAMYRFYADLNQVKVIEVARDDDFQIDVNAVKGNITASTKLVFLANPNNPTGTIIPLNAIIELLDLGLPTIVDEAYYEFTGETVLSHMQRYPNLMVLRTFSKWAGLAGLRVGYGIFPETIANYLHAIRDPYNVNMAAVVGIRESLQDLNWLMENVKKIVTERKRFMAALNQLPWLKPYPSKANFILCQILKGSAKELQQYLENHGILTRYFGDNRLKNCIRFSVGKPEEDDILLESLKVFGEAQNG
jgi:histidinol-phosphate aminotransferase